MISRSAIGSSSVWTLVVVSLSVFAFPLVRAGAKAESDPAPAIRITPPAQGFDDAKRLDELAARRKHVADAIGAEAMLVLFRTEPRVYTNDVDYPFRQENNLYYLTNLNQKGSTLVLSPGNTLTPEILFLPRRSPTLELWNGRMYSPQEAAELSGIKEIWDAREFDGFVKALQKREVYRPKPQNVLMSSTQSSGGFDSLFNAAAENQATLFMLDFPTNGESREDRQEKGFAAGWPQEYGITIKNTYLNIA